MREFRPVPKPEKQASKKTLPTRIKPRSTKRAKQEREYARLAKEFLATHKTCEGNLTGCTGASECVHHSAGRIGKDRITDVRYFKASCYNCNNRIEANPSEGVNSGFYFIGRNKS